MHGYNIRCMGRETPHFEETSPIWDYTPRPCGLNLLEGGRRLAPLEEFSLSLLWQVVNGSKGTECSGEEEPTRQGGRGGLITPLGGTSRGTDPQGPGIGRWQLLGTQVDKCVRA